MRISGTADGHRRSDSNQEPPSRPARFVELAQITLARPVASDGGPVPAGSTGTVVHVWRGGAACEVEFTRPFSAIATVRADDIAA